MAGKITSPLKRKSCHIETIYAYMVVHVRSKNPRNTQFTLDSKKGNSFDLRIQKIPMDAKEGTVFSEDDEDAPNLINPVDILGNSSGIYQFLPNAEMDDMYSIE